MALEGCVGSSSLSLKNGENDPLLCRARHESESFSRYYSGIRLATGCSLLVEDFRQDGEEATLRLCEKGDKRRTISLHYAAAQAIHEYIQHAEIASGPLFRPRRQSHAGTRLP